MKFRKKHIRGFYKHLDKVQRGITYLRVLQQAKPNDKVIRHRLDSLLCFDKDTFKVFLPRYTKFLTTTCGVDAKPLLVHLIQQYELYVLEHGEVQALKFFKELYGLASRYATSNMFVPIPFCKADSKGFPKILEPFRGLLKGEITERKAALGILQLIKMVRCPHSKWNLGQINKQPICSTSAFQKDPVELGTYFREAFKKLTDQGASVNIDINRLVKCYRITVSRMFPKYAKTKRLDTIKQLSSLHFSGRNGPNGPCLSTVVLDHDSLEKDQQLFGFIRAMSTLTENKDLNILLDNFDEEVYTYESRKPRKVIHSKINLKEESWGRLRPFATVDYFTHSSLKGFHKWLYNYLERLEEDCTFNQEKGANAIRLWTTSSVETESADLSEATNAIPLLIQREIVEAIAGTEFAHLWSNIISNRDFQCPDRSYTRYTCGQPMGASSSWPMLAMWHHIVARTCLTYLSIPWGPNHVSSYYVIGDDIAMRGQQLFKIYETVVGTLCDVGISKVKGFHTETQNLENKLIGEDYMVTAEFAKRIFCNGYEVTPIPPDEVEAYIHSPTLLGPMLSSLIKRDYSISPERVQALAEISFDSQLALDSIFATPDHWPLTGNQSEDWVALQAKTTWSKLGLNRGQVSEKLFSLVRENIISTLLSVSTNLNEWFKLAVTDGEVKVKAWTYQCETQGLVFYLTVEHCKRVVGNELQAFEESFEAKPENWQNFKVSLGRLQVIFEIDNLFKGVNKPKDDKRAFTYTLIHKAVKKLKQNPLG